MEGWRQNAGQRAREVGQVTDRYVHENAWLGIALAAVAGCVVGYFLSRSRYRVDSDNRA